MHVNQPARAFVPAVLSLLCMCRGATKIFEQGAPAAAVVNNYVWIVLR